MDNEKELSPQESLQIIESMISKAKNQFAENGHLYLLWGWLVFICGLAQFFLLHVFHYQYYYIVWFSTWIAVIYQVWYLRKKIKQQRVRTYADGVIGYVWLAFIIMAFLIGFITGQTTGQEKNLVVTPAILAVYGMPAFLSGIILRFKPLILGGIGCWVLALGASFVSYDFQLLFIPGAMLVAWIVPGYLMRAKFKSQQS